MPRLMRATSCARSCTPCLSMSCSARPSTSSEAMPRSASSTREAGVRAWSAGSAGLKGDDVRVDAVRVVGCEHERGVGLAGAQQPCVLAPAAQAHRDRFGVGFGGCRGEQVLQQAPVGTAATAAGERAVTGRPVSGWVWASPPLTRTPSSACAPITRAYGPHEADVAAPGRRRCRRRHRLPGGALGPAWRRWAAPRLSPPPRPRRRCPPTSAVEAPDAYLGHQGSIDRRVALLERTVLPTVILGTSCRHCRPAEMSVGTADSPLAVSWPPRRRT